MLKKAGSLTLIRLAGDIANLLLFVVLSRHFGPEGIGLYAYGLAIGGLAYSCINFGLEDLAIRECAGLDQQARVGLIGRLVGLQLAIALAVLLFLLGFITVKGHGPEESFIILALAAYQFALGLARTLFAPAFARQAMIWPLAAEFVSRLIIVVAAVGLVTWWNASLAAAVSPYPVGGLVFLLLAAFSAKRQNGRVRVCIPWRLAGDTLRTVWPFGAAIIISTLQVRSNFILMSLLLGKEATGLYASSIKFVEFGVLPLVFLAFTHYPDLSRHYHANRPEEFRRLANRLYLLSSTGGLLLTWALFFVVPVLVTWMLGRSFAASAPVLQALSVLGVLMAADIPANRLLQAARLQKKRVTCMVVGVAINIFLALLLIPSFGLYGAVIATIAGQLAMTLLSLITLHRFAGGLLDRRLDLLTCGALLLALAAGSMVSLVSSRQWHLALASLLAGGAVLAGAGLTQGRRIDNSGAGAERTDTPERAGAEAAALFPARELPVSSSFRLSGKPSKLSD